VLIDDLLKRSSENESKRPGAQVDLFADFNGLPSPEARTEFYQHNQNWSNRMILGDSLQAMASLAEREGLRGKVQCIYVDPPYGIKFNSNFQWSTKTTKVTDGAREHISREPEQVKAFRDTWRDGVHSYLTYLRDRLTVGRDLLSDSGSIFVQIGDENVHRVRAVLDEIFSPDAFVSLITYKTSIGLGAEFIDNTCNYLLWYARNVDALKFRPLFKILEAGKRGASRFRTLRLMDLRERAATEDELENPALLPNGARLFRDQGLTSRSASATTLFPVVFKGKTYLPPAGGWRTSQEGMNRVLRSDRLLKTGQNVSYRKFFDDFSALAVDNFWDDVSGGITNRADPKVYVVQTSTSIVERCILMTTDPGDLVLDPTCGAGTTATVAEHWGRRWITVDTSRVALALARARVMGGRYPYYLLADSREGQIKEAEITCTVPSTQPIRNNIRHGFVCERIQHITLKSIANNAEIDVIWEKWQQALEPIRLQLNDVLKKHWEEWEIPRDADAKWPQLARELHSRWWQARVERQKEMDDSIRTKAEFEYLYNKACSDPTRVRVAGPFTVESLSPHRVLGVDENDNVIDSIADRRMGYEAKPDFPQMIIENLRTAGV